MTTGAASIVAGSGYVRGNALFATPGGGSTSAGRMPQPERGKDNKRIAGKKGDMNLNMLIYWHIMNPKKMIFGFLLNKFKVMCCKVENGPDSPAYWIEGT